MSEFLQFILAGMTVGAIYSVVALGFTMVFNASGVVNFAQGEFVMLGGMLTVYGLALGMPYSVAALFAVVATSLISVALYDFAIRPARGAPVYALIIITVGASILIRGLTKIAFGTGPRDLPPLLGDEPVRVAGAVILPQSMLVIASTLAIYLCLWLLLQKTLLGHAVVASANNRMAAQMVGIDVDVMTRFSFSLSAAIGAFSGILISPITLVSYDMGTMLALKGFAAAILGGMGSPLGAILGGVLVGLSEAMSAGYLSSQYKDATAFVIIILVLFVFPNGLVGKSGHERV